jgi:transmembrane sensor
MTLHRFNSHAVGGDPREVAAYWLTREAEGELAADDTAARDAWLADSPEHRAAYDSTVRAMKALESHAADPRLLALRDAALSVKVERPVFWRTAATLLAAAMIIGGAWTASLGDAAPYAIARLAPFLNPDGAVYQTAVGERSTITLPDGSVATLNTDTIVRVAFTDRTRAIRLVRGQALFEVAHNKTRPFEVHAGDRTVTAVGTVFDVRLDGDEVKVALVEGVVRVRARPAAAAQPAPQVTMTAGEVLEAHAAEPMVVRGLNAERETSWRTGVVVFDETPLAEAAAELNRYSKDQLFVADPSIAQMHVTGVFKTGDLVRFARTVEEILPVTVEDGPKGATTLTRRMQSISPRG